MEQADPVHEAGTSNDVLPVSNAQTTNERDYLCFNHQDNNEDEDFDENYDNYNDDEEEDGEEEDYPRVYYHMNIKPDPNIAKKAEAMKQKIEGLKEKKKLQKEAENYLNIPFPQEARDVTIHIRKAKKLAPFLSEVSGCCYIPERNLIFILQKGGRKALIYSSLSFKAVGYRNFEKAVFVVRFAKELERVIFGGADRYVETYNVNTFKMEAQSNMMIGSSVEEVKFLKKNNTIAAGTRYGLHIFSKSLALQFILDLGSNMGIPRGIVSLHANYALMSMINDRELEGSLYLCDLKDRTITRCKDIEVAYVGPLEVTKKTPFRAVTCLIASGLGLRKSGILGRSWLVQLKLDTKRKEIVLHKRDRREYLGLLRIRNSEYFAAHFAERGCLWTMLMKISGDTFELIKTVRPLECNIYLSRMFAMLNQGSMMVGTDTLGRVCIFGFVVKRSRKLIKDDEKQKG